MLARENRIRGQNNFALMRKEGRIIQNPLFGVSVLRKEGRVYGVVVSKKISKLAVERNKIRRRIFEGVRKNWKEGQDKCWMLFLVKKEIMEADMGRIEAEIKKVLGEIR